MVKKRRLQAVKKLRESPEAFSVFAVIAVLAGCHASVFFEEGKEVILGCKPQLVADLLYGRVCLCKQLIDDFQLAVCDVG